MGDRRRGRQSQMQMVRGVVVGVDDSKQQQLLDVRVFGDEVITGVEHWHPSGFSQNVKPGAEAWIAFAGGDRSHPIVINTADRRVRPTNLQEGDTSVFRSPSEILTFTESGLKVETQGDVTITAAGAIALDCNDIRCGGMDATTPVAMEGTLDDAGHALISNFSTVLKTK